MGRCVTILLVGNLRWMQACCTALHTISRPPLSSSLCCRCHNNICLRVLVAIWGA